ncbi:MULTISPECIES: N-acetyltransferase [unclassified Moritella]|uniref:GNAT family N-acetyltransferase n=1 Tax=unclassified Moritella TaxID=2637987 RepID=UPI001BA47E0B|nr:MULTISPECIES: GNAT family N-acetyltransferase [unclassified Moritella]QUM85026.1 GNAT family N-acetyltransferase [Moritella sp. 28]QUM89259.1 GNAT family N-acetyltransferase [Moritella sp. 36]
MDIQFKSASEMKYAESLTQSNMSRYYLTRNIVWDSNLYKNNWAQLDNFDIFADGLRVGVVRFSYNESTTFLRDLQLSPEFQGKGIGSKSLDIIVEHARQHKSTKLLLRVFSENPAVKLYKEKKFTQTVDVNGLIEMELTLSSSLPFSITRV